MGNLSAKQTGLSLPRPRETFEESRGPPSPPTKKGKTIAAKADGKLSPNNGKITKDELPDSLAERLMKADANGDGAITKDELMKAREKMRGGRPGRPGGGAPQ